MGMPNPGYRFNILNERAQPVLSLVFERRDDAEQARVEVAKAVAKAVEVTRPALTAAGERQTPPLTGPHQKTKFYRPPSRPPPLFAFWPPLPSFFLPPPISP